MKKQSTPCSPRVRVATALLVLLANIGCVPDVAWLPDSSGIIYTTTHWQSQRSSALPEERNGWLMHFDLAKRTPRRIAKTDTGTINGSEAKIWNSATIQPAISADGKRIAVARLNVTQEQAPTLQVVVYDLRGKEVHRSKTFEWGKKTKGVIGREGYPQLFWAPQGNKLLVQAAGTTGICDLDKDQAVMLGAGIPSIYGTTPIRPDGKGFLIARKNGVFFVDWEGKEAAVKVPVDKLSGRLSEILYCPAAVCWTRWEGDVAIATWKGAQIRIDTTKRIGTWHQVDEPAWAFDGKEIQQVYAFPDGNTKIVVQYLVSWRDFQDAGLATVRVLLVGPRPNQRHVLVEEAYHCGVYPSPDKKLVALRYYPVTTRDSKLLQDRILIVDAEAEMVAEIDTAR